MARLDPAIERLLAIKGQELIFETGAGAYIRTASGPQPVVKQALSAQQIIGAFSELVPDELKPTYPAEGMTSFNYASPAGLVAVRVEKRAGMVRAMVLPEADEHTLPPVAGEGAAAARPAGSSSGHVDPTATRASWAWGPTVARVVPVKRQIVERRVYVGGEPREAMEELLVDMIERRASDMHLTSGWTPTMRIDGSMTPIDDYGVLEPKRLQDMLFSIAPERNREEWLARKDTDFAHENEKARYRVNLFSDRAGIGAVMRQIPNKILSAEEMGLSKPILDLCTLTKGLVVVTGPTGSGKSTTLAAMIDYVNRTRDDHVITIEDPIEFVHPNKKCLVNQREVGVHTDSFRGALRAALREDPDILLVGEMRDLETVSIAIETAETGHLVFGTLHTTTAASTVDRIIDQFPTDRQQQIRLMLSESLKGVVAQTLCRKIGGGRVAAQEVLLCTNAVSNLIREGKTFQIPSIMQTSRGIGMVTLNDALADLVKRRVIEPTEAYLKAVQKAELKLALERAGFQVNVPAPAVPA